MRWRPQAGHLCGFRNSIRLTRAASQVIARPTPVVVIRTPTRCGSFGIGLVSCSTARMWVRTEVRVTSARVRNMGVDLGGAEVCVAEHLLDRAQVSASLEEVRGEGMAEEVRMHAGRVESRLRGQAPEDKEGAGPGQRTALRVQEELRAVSAIEERPAPGEAPAHG